MTQDAVNGSKRGGRRRGGKEGERRQNCIERKKKERDKRWGEDCADKEQGKVKRRRVRKLFLFISFSICFMYQTSLILSDIYLLTDLSIDLSVHLVKITDSVYFFHIKWVSMSNYDLDASSVFLCVRVHDLAA